jgi:hypothetical protein
LPHAEREDGQIHPEVGIVGITFGLLEHRLTQWWQIDTGNAHSQKWSQSKVRGFGWVRFAWVMEGHRLFSKVVFSF